MGMTKLRQAYKNEDYLESKKKKKKKEGKKAYAENIDIYIKINRKIHKIIIIKY